MTKNNVVRLARRAEIIDSLTELLMSLPAYLEKQFAQKHQDSEINLERFIQDIHSGRFSVLWCHVLWTLLP